jgi:spore germination protein KA
MQQKICLEIEENLKLLKKLTGDPVDLVIHRFEKDGLVAALVYLDSLTDGKVLGSHISQPINQFLLRNSGELDLQSAELLLATAKIFQYHDLHTIMESILSGQAILFLQQQNIALGVAFPGFPRRAIKEPTTEKVTRGSREGFTDVLRDNLGMIRRWIRDPNLIVKEMKIGLRTKTEVNILYLNDVANPDVVSELQKRLAQIRIDGIIDSGYLSELITDQKFTFFPLVQDTERPDKVVAAILEGRVAVLVDKSPFALIVPVTSTEFYQTPGDFDYNYWVGSFLRLIRGLGTLVAVTLPGLYLAMISVNPELMPPGLVGVISSARVQVPFPAVFETFLALVVFEIFREAIVRVPGNINLILGIAGGGLIGFCGIESALVSAVTVIVVVITSLASFSTANTGKEQAWRLARFFIFFAAAGFGVLGFVLAGLTILTHMNSLKSFGVSYLEPWAPPQPLEMLDSYFRIPWWANSPRPHSYRPKQEDRSDDKREDQG